MVTLTSNPWPSPAEYEFIRQLVYKHSRIHLGAEKKEMVRQRLQRRLKAIGLSSFTDYCDILRSPEGEEELADLIDVISTHVTSFFREERHFEFLSNTVLPEWVNSRERLPSDTFRVWSAGCSSGEEPYSAAIVLSDFFGRHPGFSGQIVGTDISWSMLQHARTGIYQVDQVKLPESEWLKRYFLKGVGECEGSCRIKNEIKKMVAFYHANLLLTECPVEDPLDVVFCRNVMIYFDEPTQEELIQRLTLKLAPGGYLLVGHSESLLNVPHSFTSICPSVYRLKAPAGREAPKRLTCA